MVCEEGREVVFEVTDVICRLIHDSRILNGYSKLRIEFGRNANAFRDINIRKNVL